MSDIFETVLIPELREAQEEEVSLSTILPVDINGETVRIFLSQVLGLLDNNDIYPVGAPVPWVSDEIPNGWLECKGQAFDLQSFPKLASAYPDGLLPDFRGIALVGAKDGEAALTYDADENKSHNHGGSVASTNIGTKNSGSESVAHVHSLDLTSTSTGSWAKWNANGSLGVYSTGTYANRYINSWNNSVVHYHGVSIGAHAHSLTINTQGNTENTIKNKKVHWIVRAI